MQIKQIDYVCTIYDVELDLGLFNDKTNRKQNVKNFVQVCTSDIGLQYGAEILTKDEI